MQQTGIDQNSNAIHVLEMIFEHYGRVICRTDIHNYLLNRVQDKKILNSIKNNISGTLGQCAGLGKHGRAYFLYEDYLPQQYFGKKEWMVNGILPNKYRRG